MMLSPTNQQIVDQASGNPQGRLERRRRRKRRRRRCFDRWGGFDRGDPRRGRLVARRDPGLVDTVGPVQHLLQHGERLQWRRAHAEQRLAHGFQTVGRVQQGVGQRLVGQRAVLAERLQDVFDVVGEGGDAAHPDGIAGSLQGMGDALRHFHILEMAIAGGQPLDSGRKPGGLMGQFLQEAVQQVLIDIGRQRQRHILGFRLPRPGFRFNLLGHQLRRDQPVEERSRVRFRQRLWPADILQVVYQSRASRAVIHRPQIMERQIGPGLHHPPLILMQRVIPGGQFAEIVPQTGANLPQAHQADGG
jgi:hypothetical protein